MSQKFDELVLLFYPGEKIIPESTFFTQNQHFKMFSIIPS
jgi:hypothetical protein